MLSDLRYGLRQLLKNPGFTIVAVITLALGIGANTAIFSVVNAVLLKPLPFPQPNELVAFASTDARESGKVDLNNLSYPDFFDFREQNRTFASMAVHRAKGYALMDASGAQTVQGRKVSAEFFDVLGVKPVRGRGFERGDEQAGGGAGRVQGRAESSALAAALQRQSECARANAATRRSRLLDHRRHAGRFSVSVPVDPGGALDLDRGRRDTR